MYKDTVTVFNKHGHIWTATVLRNVDLNTDRSKIIGSYGESCQDRAILHIKYREDGPATKIGDIVYHSPALYIGSGITFKTGDDFTFFIPGTWDGEITIDDDDYPMGFFDHVSQIMEAYKVTAVAKYSVIPHFELLGR